MKSMRILAAGLALGSMLAISACSGDQVTPTGQAAISAGVTLAKAAAASNQDVAAVVAGGQLFCEGSGIVFAVLDATGKPSSVIGKAAPVVAQACKVVSAIAVPVPPPVIAADVLAVVPPVPILPG